MSDESESSSPLSGDLVTSDPEFFVVGIGASAGGVTALREFFRHVQADSNMAFVVIQHLSPEHESSLPALLQTQTTIPVTQVTEKVRVEPNHIYVIPPASYLVLADGCIRLTAPERRRGSPTSIDLLFRTLADAYGKNAVGILLSGAGSDGTFGLRRIKEAGGFVIAQDPSEAEYPEMPRNAIDSGLVDLVLPVSAMAEKLRELSESAQRLQLPDHEETVRTADEATLREILLLLRLRTGHDFAHYRRPTLLRRIARRMQVRAVNQLADYLSFLRNSPEELEVLFRDLLITVTNFFRDHESFEVLGREVIPKLFEGKASDDQVRVWSAGCATGEEAYSLAMMLAEYASRLPAPPSLQVFGTDIDERAIVEARTARYPATIALDVSPERLQSFLLREGDHYRIKKELREIVLFAVHNVLRDPPFSRLDLISCRNLLIYLNREMQERILETFHFALRPDGYLFLGGSESADTTPDLFVPVDKKHRIYRRRPTAQSIPAVTREWLAPRWQSASAEAARISTVAGLRSIAELHREVMEQIGPASILANEQFDIVHLSPHAGRYLRLTGGEPTRNLLKLVHPDLRPDLHAAWLEARSRPPGAAIQSRRLRIELENKPCWVTLTVRQVTDRPEAARGFYLIIFDEAIAVAPIAAAPPEERVAQADLDAVSRLEEELQHTKEQLRLTIEQYETSTEELRASNEELQAINEELRSATEELETSKEELQSVNEELSTVNQEYREKIEEVGRANSDLQNLMASTDIGTIFLDRGLRIKRYTPPAQRLFNIVDADIGRPLQHFTHQLDYPSLTADAQEVLRTLQTIEREVRSSDGSWYLARLLPYRTVDDRIDGVVLTFVDITSRRLVEEQLREQAARLREQAEIVNLGDFLVRGSDDRILLWSNGCERLYGYSREEAIGQNVHQLLKTEFPQPLAEIQAMLEKSGQWEGELVNYDRSGNRIVVVSRWVLHRADESRPPVVLQVDNDITARRQAEEALRQADRNKDRFLATLAHELRNPLGAMLNSIELIARSCEGKQEIERANQVLHRQIRHLIRLVDDLLDVERLAHGKIALQKQRARLSDIVDAAIEMCRPMIDLKSRQFTVTVPAVPVIIEVDVDRMVQVIANLLHNAFKYTQPGDRIDLTAETQNYELTISVRDTGVGIAPELLPRIFDMYSQGSGLPGSRPKGLGLGLTLVRQLVELHGGNVAVHSEGLQKGAEFVIRLPLLEEPTIPQEPVQHQLAAGRDAGREGLRILVVDDHRDAAYAMAALLETLGHKVETCYEGTAALEIARAFQPEVVVVDIGLPDIDGYEVARKMRQILPDAMLIALTGWVSDDHPVRAREAGFHHYLVKPVQLSELTSLLATRRSS
jgi:two-component system CheB/CheR fusion protein